MSQNLKVYRDLTFLGHADADQNIGGNPMYKKVFWTTHLTHDNDTTYNLIEATQGGALTHSVEVGGAMLCTSGGTNLDLCEMTYTVLWGCAKNCVMEARVKMTPITNVAMAVGFADAAHGQNNEIVAEITSAAQETRATEFAGFIFDTASSADTWYYGASKSGAPGTPVATAIAPAASIYQNLRVEMNTDGDATFYINGTAVGFLPTCVTTGTLLTPIWAFIDKAGTATAKGYVDRITCWQDE